MKEKIKKLKEKLEPKEGENGKRKTENLVVFAIVLIITVVAMNYILSGKKDELFTEMAGNLKWLQVN